MDPVDIPGYYYDAAKKRYFKIERDGTTPLTADWAAGNVKRRRKEESEQADVKKRKELRLQRRVTRAPLLGLQREFGFCNAESPAEAGIKAWAGGLSEKGEVDLWPGLHQRQQAAGDVGVMWVGGREGSDLALVVGAVENQVDGNRVGAAYVVNDANDRISNEETILRCRRSRPFGLQPPFPYTTSITYHTLSNRLFFTPGTPSTSLSVSSISPSFDTDVDHPPFQHLSMPIRNSEPLSINTALPCPASSDLTAILATTIGPATLNSTGRFSLLTSTLPRHPKKSKHLPDVIGGDILSLALLPSNPSIILSGTRRGNIGIIDTRAPTAWLSLHHGSSVAHLKTVEPFQVLAAGPGSKMSVYDIRYVKDSMDRTEWEKREPNRTRSVVEFVGYVNEEHVDFGLDVWTETSAGVVAAATGDGGVGLWSLRDGMRLKGGKVDEICVESGKGWLSRRVVKTLQFVKLGGEREVSLWVGERGLVKKYGVGRGEEW